MTSLTHVRTAVKRLDEVESLTVGGESYAVDGAVFLAIAAARDAVLLHLPVDDAAKVVADMPGATQLDGGADEPTVTVPLDAMNGMQANAVIGRAWAHRAPVRLTQVGAAASAVDGDLPRSIGRPATSALHGAGIATLADLAGRTQDEVAALHGVGPKAVRILTEALAARHLEWAVR
ncbi:hypothetical protein [Aeromicrobium alkaliterrae]|uniref:DNA-binding protein n=1 Tax=Aeromicrobium alkaliterrae TaxID=302168 RepID=A0ABP4VK75_9ACTN